MDTLSLLLMLLAHLGQPRDLARAVELANVAADVASTDATEDEAAELVTACIHESRCHPTAIGDGGAARGAWQVHGRDADARGALARLRWSERACGVGDLSLFAGCRRCGACPAIVASLLDPSLPRR